MSPVSTRLALAAAGPLAVSALIVGAPSATSAAAHTTPVPTTPAVVAPWAETVMSGVVAPRRPANVDLAQHADGTALATWPITAKDGGRPSRTAVAPVDATGKAGPATVLSRYLMNTPTSSTRGTTDLLLARLAPTHRLSGLEVRTASATGEIGRAQPLGHALLVGDATLAVAPSGVAVAAWTELRPLPDRDSEGWTVAVKIAVRNAGAPRFAAPRTLQTTASLGDGPVDASIAADGRFVIAYDDHGLAKDGWGVRAWTGSVTVGVRSRAVRLGPSATTSTVRTAITRAGRAIVAWGTVRHGEEVHSPWTVRAAALTPAGTRSGSAQLVDGSGDEAFAPPSIALAFTPDGRATLAWSHVGALRRSGERAGNEVRVATTSVGSRFGVPQEIAATEVGGLAVRDDGASVLTVGGNAVDGASAATFALVRPAAAATFSAPELLAHPFTSGTSGALRSRPGTPQPTFDAAGRPVTASVDGALTGWQQLLVQRRDRP